MLEQEKVPFLYRGEKLEDFSQINIITGYSGRIPMPAQSETYFIVEPALKEIGSFVKNENFNFNKALKKKGNILRLQNNYSLRMMGAGGHQQASRNRTMRFLKKIVMRSFELADIPYVHAWYYPENVKSILLFRQDVDYVDRAGLRMLGKITDKFKIRGTYFLNISGEEEFDEKIGHLRIAEPTSPQRIGLIQEILSSNNEVANHGYWHWVFQDFKKNYLNIRKCSLCIDKILSVKCKGFAAPGAEWNESLIKAIRKNKLSYSCCGIDNSGFPYYLHRGNKKEGLLEIPFYFICDASLESMQDSGGKWIIPEYLINKLKEIHINFIKRQICNNEPIAIMGHPHLVEKIGKDHLNSFFGEIKRLGIPDYTIEKFADWWRQRGKIRISCRRSDKGMLVSSNSKNTFVEVIYRGHKKILHITKEPMLIKF